ncbi:hypothetical protein OV760_28435, partial [Salmonella enterica subsp. enterica serovar 1,4,[5],12:i:-]|nr:hypothetical protein [Salmonella enterica subsp. enterica serovar 1,4,[5],12:i:-]
TRYELVDVLQTELRELSQPVLNVVLGAVKRNLNKLGSYANTPMQDAETPTEPDVRDFQMQVGWDGRTDVEIVKSSYTFHVPRRDAWTSYETQTSLMWQDKVDAIQEFYNSSRSAGFPAKWRRYLMDKG